MPNFENKDGAGSHERRDFRDKIRIYKVQNLYRAILIIAVVVVIAIIVRVQYLNHVYTGYTVVSAVERSRAADARDIRLGSSILTYSKDGAHLTDSKGYIPWNQTYEIQDITLDTAGNVVAIGNYNGRDVYVLDDKAQLCKISTTMPIRNVAVSESGVSTIIIYDTNVTYINTYNANGELLYSGQAHMTGSGYPAGIALSPNGKLLAVSYIYVDAGTVKTTVAFYNFGPVGDNYKDYLVGGHDYTDTIVPEVGFLSNSTAYAVADNRLMFYSGDEQPSPKTEYLEYSDKEIRSIYSGNSHLGIVMNSDKPENRYRMDVYDSNGSLTGKFYFDIEYADIFFEKNGFVIYNESECLIKTYDGRTKFEGKFDSTVNVMLPTDKAYRYVIADSSNMYTIQLN
ncbi:MAG: hypothetical protein IJ796_07265 [Lachnospiraceae bacterium]|nr:hypothetical protein [Lachnospiraceae bacterium]